MQATAFLILRRIPELLSLNGYSCTVPDFQPLISFHRLPSGPRVHRNEGRGAMLAGLASVRRFSVRRFSGDNSLKERPCKPD